MCRPGWLGLRWGAFTCVGWQVTLCECDPIWQVMPRSSEKGSHKELYAPLYHFTCLHLSKRLTHCGWRVCLVHTGTMAEVAMAAALTRSASVTDSPILVGTDALSSPVGAAGDRVRFLLASVLFSSVLLLDSLLQKWFFHKLATDLHATHSAVDWLIDWLTDRPTDRPTDRQLFHYRFFLQFCFCSVNVVLLHCLVMWMPQNCHF